MAEVDIEAKEREYGNAAARALSASLRGEIRSSFEKRSGLLNKTNVRARYKDGRLDRLVMTSPHYSFKQHFGSAKKGETKTTSRSSASVSAFVRHVKGTPQRVKAHSRSGGSVMAHSKGITYKSVGHIAAAFDASNALEVLATRLGENRSVEIVSKITF